MKTILTSILCAIFLQVSAQPTLNSTMFPVPGNSFDYIPVNPIGMTPGPAGANQTWNFTSVNPIAPAITVNFVSPASTPYAANHPGATVCQPQSDGAGGIIYAYHIHNSTETYLKGLSYLVGSQPLHFIYSNPEKAMQYPFTYNNSFTDNFVASYTFVQSGVTIVHYRNGIITTTADGYGTLQIPGSTFSNVLRVKSRQALTDSTVYVGIAIPPVVSYFTSTTHNWFATNLVNKMSQFTLSFDTTVSASNPTTYNAFARYQVTSTGIDDETFNIRSQISASPNPAFESTFLLINDAEAGDATLIIADINGRKVNEVTLNFIHPDNNNIMVDLKDYSQGVYYLQVIQPKRIWSSKVVRL